MMCSACPTEAESNDGSVTRGAASFITTVRGSVAVTLITGASGLAELSMVARVPLVDFHRVQVAATSSASTFRLFTGAVGCHFALPRSLKVTVRPSGEVSQLSARSPTTSPDVGSPSPGFTTVSRL
jgi:hypothetical protein